MMPAVVRGYLGAAHFVLKCYRRIAPAFWIQKRLFRDEAPISAIHSDVGLIGACVSPPSPHTQNTPFLSLQNWRAQTQLVDSLAKQFEAELADTKKQIASVNLERKLQQTAAGEVMVVVGGIKPDQADITLSA